MIMKKIADPAPLGLFSFALTTFVISAYNAGVFGVAATDPINAVVTLGLFYGGGVQALAGMWAFATGDAFAAAAFTSYGAFWLSYAALFLPSFGVHDAYAASDPDVLRHAKAIYLLGWTLFTCIMLVASTRTSAALCALFAMVASTFILLTAAEFSDSVPVHRAGGFVGILTAALAWYNALAELLLNQPDPIFTLPLGKHEGSGDRDGAAAGAFESQEACSRDVVDVCRASHHHHAVGVPAMGGSSSHSSADWKQKALAVQSLV